MATALVAVGLVLALMVTGMSLLAYGKMVQMIDDIIVTSEEEYLQNEAGPNIINNNQDDLYLKPFWIAEYDAKTGQISLIAISDESRTEELTAVSEQMARLNKKQGFYQAYRYQKKETANGILIMAANASVHLTQFRNIILIQIIAVAIGFFLFYLIFLKMASWMMRPYLQSYESQKRFTTNISHDLKTPLTVIRADADVLYGKEPDNRWISDIRMQAARMSDLIEEMLLLSRMQETGNRRVWVDFPISDIIEEEARLFEQVAEAKSKQYSYTVQPMLTFHGDAKAIRHMTGVLLDNAIRYSDENGIVRLELHKKRDKIVLSVYNTAEHISRSELPNLTERFYRTDASRHEDPDSHGIGLPLVDEIVQTHQGEMVLSTEDEKSFLVTIKL